MIVDMVWYESDEKDGMVGIAEYGIGLYIRTRYGLFHGHQIDQVLFL